MSLASSDDEGHAPMSDVTDRVAFFSPSTDKHPNQRKSFNVAPMAGVFWASVSSVAKTDLFATKNRALVTPCNYRIPNVAKVCCKSMAAFSTVAITFLLMLNLVSGKHQKGSDHLSASGLSSHLWDGGLAK